MGRPKTPSNVLELRGSFKKNPHRTRKDAEGAGEFNAEPPTHMPQEAVPAWNWLVERLPRVTLYNTDEVSVEIAARLLARYWLTQEVSTLKELRAWLMELGFSPKARTNLPPAAQESDNPFERHGKPPKKGK